MNLKEFAVQRKMDHGDPLLKYVAKNKPVPCDVLEDSLKDLLEPLEDARASHLVSDYVGMLQTYIPITYKQNQDNSMTISGEVPEDILESIELIHEVTAEDALSAMIQNNVSSLRQAPASVNSLKLQELESTLNTIQSMPPVMSLDDINDIVDNTVQETTQESAPEFEPELMVDEPTEDIKDVVAKRIEAMEQDIEDSYTPMEYEMEAHDEMDYEMEDPVEDESTQIAMAMKRVYNRVVDDIKQAGLDTKLGLNLH